MSPYTVVTWARIASLAILLVPISAPTVSTTSIVGRVLDNRQESLAGARVRVEGLDSDYEAETLADQQGAFVLNGLPIGWYRVRASHPGYVGSEFGATTVDGMGMSVIVDGKSAPGLLTIVLPTAAAVEGAVRKSDAQLLGNVRVDALREIIDARGSHVYETVGSNITDERGRYYIGELKPGRYVFRASPPQGPISSELVPGNRQNSAQGAPTIRTGYAVTYYPMRPDLVGLQPLELESGQVFGGLDIIVRRVPLAQINGRWIGVPPLDSLEVSAEPVDRPGPASNAFLTRTSFSFSDLQPGRYVVRARGKENGVNELGACELVEIFEGQAQLEMTLQLVPLGTVIGRTSFARENTAAGVQLSLIDASGSPVPRPSVRSLVQPDGTVIFPNVLPGAYRPQVVVSPKQKLAWSLTSARVGQSETISGSFTVNANQRLQIELTLTPRRGQLAGSLVTPQGMPATAHSLVLFPEDRSLWPVAYQRVSVARPATTGEFRLPRLLPGSYRLAVVNDLRTNEWLLPAFLPSIVAQSIPVTISATGSDRIDLRVQK